MNVSHNTKDVSYYTETPMKLYSVWAIEKTFQGVPVILIWFL